MLSPNTGDDNPYVFHFTLGALAVTSVFYAARVFLVPYLGFAVPAAARFTKNRRVWFGVAAMGLFFTPVLFLPGRIETAYCYLPFTGLALALAGAAEMVHPGVIVAFLVLFLPWEIHDVRIERRDKLTKDDDARAWVHHLPTLRRRRRTRRYVLVERHALRLRQFRHRRRHQMPLSGRPLSDPLLPEAAPRCERRPRGRAHLDRGIASARYRHPHAGYRRRLVHRQQYRYAGVAIGRGVVEPRGRLPLDRPTRHGHTWHRPIRPRTSNYACWPAQPSSRTMAR